MKTWFANYLVVTPTFDGYHADFSPDGAQLVSMYEDVVTIQNPSSGAVVVKFPTIKDSTGCCYFSPDGKLVAVATGRITHVWNVTSPKPYLVETFIGHINEINSIAFSSPSSLISISVDQLVKFWQIGTQPTELAETNLDVISLGPATIRSITLQAKDNIFITSDSDGVVKTWDIFTGICKASFQTPVKGANRRDVQMINGKLILAWHIDGRIRIWDVEKEELLLTAGGCRQLQDIKISEDGSRVFSINARMIQAQSTQTGEILGKTGIKFVDYNVASLTVKGSRVWVHYPNSETQVWDFGTPGLSPIQLPNMVIEILHPGGVVLWDTSLSCVQEKANGKVVFRLPKRYGKPVDVQWNGQYLAASFISGEVLVLDFGHVLPLFPL